MEFNKDLLKLSTRLPLVQGLLRKILKKVSTQKDPVVKHFVHRTAVYNFKK